MFELLIPLCIGRLRRLRFTVSLSAASVLIGCMVLILAVEVSYATMLVSLLSVYRFCNVARVLRGRMHERYLERAVFRTTLWLAGCQAFVLLFAVAWQQDYVTSVAAYGVLLALQLLFIAASGITVFGYLRRSRLPDDLPAASAASLPTVSVVIPARNESEDLAECITSLLALQYPKLEIIVLDDCSQSTRTPEIIKSFAHDGVRFIKGSDPKNSWLAKNQAYDNLTEAANGEYLLFCGVDVRFAVFSLRRLMTFMRERRLEMICVMPQNVSGGRLPALVQPMRYVWELALPRQRRKRPPVLSTCWVISRKTLIKLGGFQAVARMVVPEAHFAKQLAGRGSYEFMTSGSALGVTSVKSLYEQRQTAVRVAYPQLHRRPEMTALVSAVITAWFTLPAAAVAQDIYRIGFALILIASFSLYALIVRIAYHSIQPLSLLALPAAAVWYAILINYSMYKYEFSEVIWKDRNICLPVMRVEPHLPKI